MLHISNKWTTLISFRLAIVLICVIFVLSDDVSVSVGYKYTSHKIHHRDYDNLLHRMTTLLSKEHIVMMGDSLMRYQYISMAYILKHRQLLLKTVHPNPVEEKQWPSFNDFYLGTNGLLSPYEKCDCYRGDIYWPYYNLALVFENRFWNDPVDKTTLTYMHFWGDENRGHWSPIEPFNNDSLRVPLKDYIKPSWSYKLPDTLDRIVSKFLPTPSILILNCGFWENDFLEEDYFNRVYEAAFRNFKTVVWKTTNYRKSKNESILIGLRTRESIDAIDQKWCNAPKVLCLNLSWTKDIDSELYWDELHFKAPVYWEVIAQTLKLLDS